MKYKTYIIEGKEFNATDLAKEVGISQPAARNRLKTNKTIKDLYRPLHITEYKKHIIEGKEFTSLEIAKILNCSDSTARARLNQSSTLKELLTPIYSRTHSSDRCGKIIKMDENTAECHMRKLAMRAW